MTRYFDKAAFYGRSRDLLVHTALGNQTVCVQTVRTVHLATQQKVVVNLKTLYDIVIARFMK